MKNTFFLFSVLVMILLSPKFSAQIVLGTYEQETLVAPDEYRDSEDDVQITRDPKSSKKIWIHNLIPNQKFYGIANMKNEDMILYSVPKQRVGNYIINLGCAIYRVSEGEIVIALNNKTNCFGISQSDYDDVAVVNKRGISAGGVKVGSNGEISTKVGGVNKDGVQMNVKEIMSGIQYIGKKM
ncbi:MAG: hypothetical protein Q4G16_09890 [Cruoricaptor ignavus]|nr:hypothetical protein [Cruoricaptor ignavus]